MNINDLKNNTLGLVYELEDLRNERASEYTEDKALEMHLEQVLEVRKTTLYTVLLACGGPTEYFEVEFDSRGVAFRGEYVNTSLHPSRTSISLTDDEIDTVVSRYALGDI